MSLDMMVNTLCIMLMFSVHQKVYNVCCRHCQLLVTMQCLYCCSCACCFQIKQTVFIKNVSNTTKKLDRVPANSGV